MLPFGFWLAAREHHSRETFRARRTRLVFLSLYSVRARWKRRMAKPGTSTDVAGLNVIFGLEDASSFCPCGGYYGGLEGARDQVSGSSSRQPLGWAWRLLRPESLSKDSGMCSLFRSRLLLTYQCGTFVSQAEQVMLTRARPRVNSLFVHHGARGWIDGVSTAVRNASLDALTSRVLAARKAAP